MLSQTTEISNLIFWDQNDDDAQRLYSNMRLMVHKV